MHIALNIDKNKNKQKQVTQFVCKSRDESFKPNYFMIKQCLSNKIESAIVLKFKNFLIYTSPEPLDRFQRRFFKDATARQHVDEK